ncbi:hypothetical protein KKB18_06510, partial [bacterium]|nr:hypothetical protein [bacterium]
MCKTKNQIGLAIFIVAAFLMFFSGNAEALLKWVELDGSASGGGVSDTVLPSMSPSLALDQNGRPNIAWQESFDIYFAYHDGVSWKGYLNSNTSVVISDPDPSAQDKTPSLALDSSDHPHIVWEGLYSGQWRVYYSYFDGSSWTTYGGGNTDYGVCNLSGYNQNPKIAVDSNNFPHITWSANPNSDYEIYYTFWDGSSWTSYGGANTGNGISDNSGASKYPSIDLYNDLPQIVWQDDSNGNNEIYFAYYNSSSWVSYGNGKTGGGISKNSGSSEMPTIKILQQFGFPRVAWEDNTSGTKQIYYIHWDGTSWVSYGGSNTGNGLSNSIGASTSATIGISGTYYPNIAWQTLYYSGSQIQFKRWNGSAWSEIDGSSGGMGLSKSYGYATKPSIVINQSNSRPHIAWQDNSSGYTQIYYKYVDDVTPTSTATATKTSTPPTPTPAIPELFDPSLTPDRGNTNTTFVYRISYKDVTGSAPILKRIIIDGEFYKMNLVEGYANYGVYSYETKLSIGSHNYKFYFQTSGY